MAKNPRKNLFQKYPIIDHISSSSSFGSDSSNSNSPQEMSKIPKVSYATKITSTPNNAKEPSPPLDEFFLSLISEDFKSKKSSKKSLFASSGESSSSENLYVDFKTGENLKPKSLVSKSKVIKHKIKKKVLPKKIIETSSSEDLFADLKTLNVKPKTSLSVIKRKNSNNEAKHVSTSSTEELDIFFKTLDKITENVKKEKPEPKNDDLDFLFKTIFEPSNKKNTTLNNEGQNIIEKVHTFEKQHKQLTLDNFFQKTKSTNFRSQISQRNHPTKNLQINNFNAKTKNVFSNTVYEAPKQIVQHEHNVLIKSSVQNKHPLLTNTFAERIFEPSIENVPEKNILMSKFPDIVHRPFAQQEQSVLTNKFTKIINEPCIMDNFSQINHQPTLQEEDKFTKIITEPSTQNKEREKNYLMNIFYKSYKPPIQNVQPEDNYLMNKIPKIVQETLKQNEQPMQECSQVIYPAEKSFTLTTTKPSYVNYIPGTNNSCDNYDTLRILNPEYTLECTESKRKKSNNSRIMMVDDTPEKIVPKNRSKTNPRKIVSAETQSQIFLQSLLSDKKIDVHGTLLDYFNLQGIEFDFLRKSLQETNLRFMSDKMLHGSPKKTISPSKKTCFKKYVKGETKLYYLNVVKKKTIIDQPEVKDSDNLEDFLYSCTQEKVNLLDRTFKSFSSDGSFITRKSGESQALSTGSNKLPRHQGNLRSGINDVLRNKDFLYDSEDDDNYRDISRKEIVQKIENIFLNVLDDFENNRNPTLTYKRQCWDNLIFRNGRCQFKKDPMLTIVYYNRKASCKKFCLMFYLLDQIRKYLISDTITTKREMYYQIKTYVQNQGITDSSIMAVSCLLNVGPWDLNIVAQKGLVYGNLKLKLSSGEVINCNVPGTTIPLNVKEITKIETSCYFILVVEKESIFHKLIQEDLPNSLTRPFIMITGKGFPDHNTQLFVKKLWMVLSAPVFILVDPDPQGIQIMLNYRVGSLASAHLSHDLAIPKAQWLGVFPTEIRKYSLEVHYLTEKDIKTVKDMLLLPHIINNEKIKKELQFFLDNKYKSDIEALVKSANYLSRIYLTEKMINKNFI